MKNLKIIITGANGQLGSDLVIKLQEAGHLVVGLTHSDAALEDTDLWLKILKEQKPNILINTAAFHHVDQCEADLDKAMLINCFSPAKLAKACLENNIQFIHFSTDYVFNGKKNQPYIESDIPFPLNNYGLSKLKGEEAIMKENPNSLILRISAIYGLNPCRAKNGLNFVQLMLKKAHEGAHIKVVDDEQVSPTPTKAIAIMVNELLELSLSGIVHLTSEGNCSWYEFAQEIFHYAQLTPNLERAQSSDFPAKTPRPNYSVLENKKLKDLGLNQMPHWMVGLHQYLDEISVNTATSN